LEDLLRVVVFALPFLMPLNLTGPGSKLAFSPTPPAPSFTSRAGLLDFPIEAFEVSAAALDGMVYTVCGLTPAGAANRMFIYDRLANAWSEGEPAPLPDGGDHCNLAAAAGKLYLLGALVRARSLNTTRFERTRWRGGRYAWASFSRASWQLHSGCGGRTIPIGEATAARSASKGADSQQAASNLAVTIEIP
jgi:hypothetical protein